MTADGMFEKGDRVVIKSKYPVAPRFWGRRATVITTMRKEDCWGSHGTLFGRVDLLLDGENRPSMGIYSDEIELDLLETLAT